MSQRTEIAQAYERALFAGRMDEVAGYLSNDVVYWVAGDPPLGGEWRGPQAVVGAFENREFGLGAADWRSWLKTAPDDVLDQRTCVVIKFRDDKICDMRDYTDPHLYEQFLERHRNELPKFAAG
jgi:ketosteroid isomerase-like protein